MKKILFTLAVAVLLAGAGCKELPSADLGQVVKVQIDHAGVSVTAGGQGEENSPATSTDQNGGAARSGAAGSEREEGGSVRARAGGGESERGDGEDGWENEGGDDGEGGGRAVTPPAPAPATGKAYTMAQVAAHASGSSCWSAIGGSVYDLTGWIGQHPGGSQAILSLCGIDGTAGFDAQHGGQGNPAQELAALKIGDLAK